MPHSYYNIKIIHNLQIYVSVIYIQKINIIFDSLKMIYTLDVTMSKISL